MKRRVLTTTFAVLAVIVGTGLPVTACGCDSKPLAELLEDADVVFTATAPERSGLDSSRPIEVAVERVYKGDVAATATVWASDGPLACGIDPAGAGRDGFIASTDAGRTTIGTCLPAFGVADIEQILGPGHEPQATLAVTARGIEPIGWLAGLGAAAGVVLILRWSTRRSDRVEDDHRDV